MIAAWRAVAIMAAAGLAFAMVGLSESSATARRPSRPAGGESAAPVVVPPRTSGLVTVHSLGRSLGLESTWLEPGRKIRLGSQRTEMIFTLDRREVLINGARIFMGDGAMPGENSLRISTIDRDRLLLPILVPQQNEARGPVRVIVLDPGHGGTDRGTHNDKLGLIEKELAMDVARRLRPLLQARGFRVVLTREDDTFIPLPDRPVRAVKAGADLFVSLHFNAAGPGSVSGIETYILTPRYQRSTGSDERQPDDDVAIPGNRFDAWSSYLGYTVHRTLLADLKRFDRGLKRARFAVLRDLPCPGLLIEGGYLSNDEEAKLIGSPAWRERLATSVANGIDVYNQTLKRLEATRR